MAKQYQIIDARGGAVLSKAPISQADCEAWFDTHPYHVEDSRAVDQLPNGRVLVRVFVSERAQ